MAAGELTANFDELSERRMLHHRLVFGSYPEIVNIPAIPANLSASLPTVISIKTF
jgi:hypothetical protein